ncbi:MAG: serpin family protein [Blastocatellia bacterium]|nr:serpin family protein [Blastocatellia bacterium]
MRNNIKWLLAAGLFASLCVHGFGTGGKGSSPTMEPANKMAAAANEFGFDLFARLRAEGREKNLFFSPLSVATALTMAWNGAVGETSTAMRRALRIGAATHAEINQASAELSSGLRGADPKIELTIANSIWMRKGMNFREDFLARNRQFFGAEAASLDFADPRSLAQINGWVSASTKGKIPKILDRIGAQQVMFLINAIYFKGAWKNKFDPAQTRPQAFHLLRGEKQIPMMSQSGNFLYSRGEGYQAVTLPYGRGGVSLSLFLPADGKPLDSLLAGLTAQKWQQWQTGFRSTPGDVKLPRYKIEYENSLNNALKALGMEVAFAAGRADFSGIAEGRSLFISDVRHKAIVEVNEEGAEAAAATSVGISTTSMRPPQQRFQFVADRPFLMAIHDARSGAILFLGTVVDPK